MLATVLSFRFDGKVIIVINRYFYLGLWAYR